MANTEKPRKVLKSTQSFLPIKEIISGIVVTKDKRYIRILEVEPTNFALKSVSEQKEIMNAFLKLLKAAPVNLQFKVISQRANFVEHIEGIQSDMATETNENCKILQRDYAQLIRRVSEEEGVARRFFFIFRYTRDGLEHTPTINDIIDSIKNTEERIINNLAKCKNSVIIKKNTNEQIAELFYMLFNRRDARYVPFQQRYADVYRKYSEYYQKKNKELKYIPILDIIAPKCIDATNRKYITIDGKYYCFCYIPKSGYSPQVLAGWTSLLINAGEGIDVDIYLDREYKEDVEKKLKRSIKANRNAKKEFDRDVSDNYTKCENAEQSGIYIRESMQMGDQLNYFSILVTVTGDSLDEIDYKYHELQKLYKSYDLDLLVCEYQQDIAFTSTLPLCKLDNNIAKRARRNILTTDAVSLYPFTSYEMNEKDGVLMGINQTNGSLAILDLFNTKKRNNASLFICGEAGAGKTYTLMLLAMRMRLKHVQVFIVSPDKGDETKRACKAIGGEYIRIDQASTNVINIMEIRKPSESLTKILDEYDDEDLPLLANKVQEVITFISIVAENLYNEERQLLDDAIMSTYNKFGITMDNKSLYDSNGNFKEMPILEDLYEEIAKSEKLSRVASALRILVKGSVRNFNGKTNVNLDNEFIILDLTRLSESLLPVGMFVSINYAWSKIKEDRSKKKMLIMDEWWKFAYNPIAAEYSFEIAKTIRGYGGSAVYATQQLSDVLALDSGKFGKGVINNCATKVLLRMQADDADYTQELLHLTDEDIMSIRTAERGNALLISNNNNVSIQIKASNYEHQLITTDRAELQLLGEKKKRELQIKKENEVTAMEEMLSCDVVDMDDLIIL